MSQAKSTAETYAPGWWERIVEALGTSKTGEIAGILGISPSSVSDWKHGRSKPSFETMQEISVYGETEIKWLVSGEGAKDAPGEAFYFEEAFLPTTHRNILREIARQKNIDTKQAAQEILIEALQDRYNPENQLVSRVVESLREFIRAVVREELAQSESNIKFDSPEDETKVRGAFIRKSIEQRGEADANRPRASGEDKRT